MATVLLHLNVKVPNEVAEQDEKEAVQTAKRQVVTALILDRANIGATFESYVALAEVVDYDE